MGENKYDMTFDSSKHKNCCKQLIDNNDWPERCQCSDSTAYTARAYSVAVNHLDRDWAQNRFRAQNESKRIGKIDIIAKSLALESIFFFTFDVILSKTGFDFKLYFFVSSVV